MKTGVASFSFCNTSALANYFVVVHSYCV